MALKNKNVFNILIPAVLFFFFIFNEFYIEPLYANEKTFSDKRTLTLEKPVSYRMPLKSNLMFSIEIDSDLPVNMVLTQIDDKIGSKKILVQSSLKKRHLIKDLKLLFEEDNKIDIMISLPIDKDNLSSSNYSIVLTWMEFKDKTHMKNTKTIPETEKPDKKDEQYDSDISSQPDETTLLKAADRYLNNKGEVDLSLFIKELETKKRNEEFYNKREIDLNSSGFDSSIEHESKSLLFGDWESSFKEQVVKISLSQSQNKMILTFIANEEAVSMVFTILKIEEKKSVGFELYLKPDSAFGLTKSGQKLSLEAKDKKPFYCFIQTDAQNSLFLKIKDKIGPFKKVK